MDKLVKLTKKVTSTLSRDNIRDTGRKATDKLSRLNWHRKRAKLTGFEDLASQSSPNQKKQPRQEVGIGSPKTPDENVRSKLEQIREKYRWLTEVAPGIHGKEEQDIRNQLKEVTKAIKEDDVKKIDDINKIFGEKIKEKEKENVRNASVQANLPKTLRRTLAKGVRFDRLPEEEEQTEHSQSYPQTGEELKKDAWTQTETSFRPRRDLESAPPFEMKALEKEIEKVIEFREKLIEKVLDKFFKTFEEFSKLLDNKDIIRYTTEQIDLTREYYSNMYQDCISAYNDYRDDLSTDISDCRSKLRTFGDGIVSASGHMKELTEDIFTKMHKEQIKILERDESLNQIIHEATGLNDGSIKDMSDQYKKSHEDFLIAYNTHIDDIEATFNRGTYDTALFDKNAIKAEEQLKTFLKTVDSSLSALRALIDLRQKLDRNPQED